MREHLSLVRIPPLCNPTILSWFALLLCCALLCQPIRAQSTQPNIPSSQEKHMKHYALIFYATRTLTPEELQQRKVEIAAWVKHIEAMGTLLDPRGFGQPAASLSAQEGEIVSHQDSGGSTFSNIVFFDSPSEDQAIDIAKAHPGLHYGATVVVREWTSPREASPTR
jgi:hypothetical protein